MWAYLLALHPRVSRSNRSSVSWTIPWMSLSLRCKPCTFSAQHAWDMTGGTPQKMTSRANWLESRCAPPWQCSAGCGHFFVGAVIFGTKLRHQMLRVRALCWPMTQRTCRRWRASLDSTMITNTIVWHVQGLGWACCQTGWCDINIRRTARFVYVTSRYANNDFPIVMQHHARWNLTHELTPAGMCTYKHTGITNNTDAHTRTHADTCKYVHTH